MEEDELLARDELIVRNYRETRTREINSERRGEHS